MTMTIIEDNTKEIFYGLALYAVGLSQGWWQAPELPGYWPIVGLTGLLVVGVGYVVGQKIADLLPDPMGNVIVAMDAHDGEGGEIYEINDAAFDELEVVKGDLFAWECSANVYECREFRADDLVAVANWKGTKTGSELSKPVERSEIMRQIEELRNEHEQEARYGKAIRTSLPALLRTLDKWRAKDLNAALEGHIAPNVGDRSIDDMIRERVPEEVLPDYMGEDGGDDHAEPDGVAFEVLDDTEALDPLENPPGPEMVNDGGTEP